MRSALHHEPSARDRAQDEQRRASDPAVSAFVAASAGSGKTKLLTDRLLRLMLDGADPARIQCLTFTKAAAAEMALRLQSTLGKWVTLADDRLDDELAGRGIVPGDAVRTAARALFARVLDLPGGMRIGTIHAFCQSLLRRFPLEAQLSPHFQLVDELDAGMALRDAREDMLGSAHTDERRAALTTLAGLATADQFGKLVARLQTDRDRLAVALTLGDAGLAAALGRVLGGEPDEAALLAKAVAWPNEPNIAQVARDMLAGGSATVKTRAGEMLGWLGLTHIERSENWAEWLALFFNKDGKPAAMSRMVNDVLEQKRPGLRNQLAAEQDRIAAIEDAKRATRTAAISAALASLAGPVLHAYAARKEQAALLDYDDLIARSSKLLVDPGAAWVLYKLDGGLDHLLLDEVQDTAPAQWSIAGALTAEFFAGAGAREQTRTVFAVGDRKQSIYSFQGADPDAFEDWRGILRRRVGEAGQEWRDVALDVSFRSTAPVLSLVDAVFADPLAAAGVLAPGEALRHFPDRAGHAGSVELWPLTPLPEIVPAEPWSVHDRNMGARSAVQRLADALAFWISEQVGSARLESRNRTLAAGDVLVLVRRRNDFTRALVRALKSRKVPVAGLDRMVLTDQPAVADLVALCDTLLLPGDDLALACVLTSPLGGLDDAALLTLAAERRGSLWDALRARAAERPEFAAAAAFIATLLARVDYATPHALLAEALGPLGARARLLARLGPEAAEPVDELLNTALAYTQGHPPSLQGFVHWLRQSGAEVKREAEGAGGMVRIMTVHGAKGLQAPLVILPDTTSLPPDDGPLMWAPDAASGAEVPIWAPRREFRCAAADRLRDAAARRRAEEYNRLLYVALTRAEDRLVVCGWHTRRDPPPECWYNLVKAGFARLNATEIDFTGVPDPWERALLRHDAPQSRKAEPGAAHRDDAASAALPAWAGEAPLWRPHPPPAEPALPTPLAPSRPQDAALGPVPEATSPLAAHGSAGRFRRGELAHALLQHLPDLPPAVRLPAALRYLTRPGHGLPHGDAARLAGELLAVLDHPALAPLFGPYGRAEVPLTGVVGGRVINGLVDRLAVLPDRVLLADYKTNREAPDRFDDVPLLYLRQMAAYRAVLRSIHPGRAIECALIWTTGTHVMALPAGLLDRHAPDAIHSA